MFGLFPLFDYTLRHIELCNSVIIQIQYSEIRQILFYSVGEVLVGDLDMALWRVIRFYLIPSDNVRAFLRFCTIASLTALTQLTIKSS